MNDMLWCSWIIGIYSILLLGLLLRMKKTDPYFGCVKFRMAGCNKVSGRDCDFPDCATLGKYRSHV